MIKATSRLIALLAIFSSASMAAPIKLGKETGDHTLMHPSIAKSVWQLVANRKQERKAIEWLSSQFGKTSMFQPYASKAAAEQALSAEAVEVKFYSGSTAELRPSSVSKTGDSWKLNLRFDYSKAHDGLKNSVNDILQNKFRGRISLGRGNTGWFEEAAERSGYQSVTIDWEGIPNVPISDFNCRTKKRALICEPVNN